MGAESCPAAKTGSFLAPGKSPTTNSNFHVFTQYKLHLFIYSCSHCHCIIFFFFLASDFRHSYITLILINPSLLNLIFTLRKTLNGKIHSIKILNHHTPPPPLPFNAIFKTLLQLLLVFLFIPYNYHFKLHKFLLTPLQL